MDKLKIAFVNRRAIDTEKWNQVIRESPAETIYPYSWYLDACADQWGALLTPGYEYIMPVAFRRKWGIRYTYQPRFCQQLGIYSEKEIHEEITGSFLASLKKYFKLGDYAFNEGNPLSKHRSFMVSDHNNYFLFLGADYDQLKQGYGDNHRRNIQKAGQSKLEFCKNIPISEMVRLKQDHDHSKQEIKHYQSLTNMFTALGKEGKLKAYGVKLGPDLVAGAIFAFGKKRVHYLLSASTESGKEHSAMFYVIDRVIQMHSNRPIHLDFEGSDIPGLSRFFKGFGAHSQRYQRIRFNNAAGKFVQNIKRVRPD